VNSVDTTPEHLLLIDPDSESLAQRWRTLAPNTDVVPLPGLPDALEHAWVVG
jgi:hypothetical protein